MPADEDRATAISNTHKNFVKIGHAVPKIRPDHGLCRWIGTQSPDSNKLTFLGSPLLYTSGRGDHVPRSTLFYTSPRHLRRLNRPHICRLLHTVHGVVYGRRGQSFTSGRTREYVVKVGCSARKHFPVVHRITTSHSLIIGRVGGEGKILQSVVSVRLFPPKPTDL